MKYLVVFAVILLYPLFNTHLNAQDLAFKEDYLQRLEHSKEYLVAVAEELPEVKYSFKATLESMSFEEHLMHIAWAMDWHSQTLLGGRAARDWATDTTLKVHSKSKKEMIKTLAATFDKTITFIREFDTLKLNDNLDYLGLERTKRQTLLLLSDHITHHRAQMIVTLRLNGVKPPRYILYQ